jgi:Leucine-rich repeat (LRR) protein
MGQDQSKSKQAEIMAMNHNLDSFPQRFMREKHPKLKRINLAHNFFKDLPTSFSFAENLEELNLSYNFLDSLPKEFSNNVNMKRMDLSYNNFSEFPHVSLKKLVMLLLGSNMLKNFNHDLNVLFPNLTLFSIPRNQFEIIFLYFFIFCRLEIVPYINHPHLVKLDLDGNKIKALQSQMIAPKLETFQTAMNDIKKVQIPRLSKLPNLRSADFRGNLITGINEDVFFFFAFNLVLLFYFL